MGRWQSIAVAFLLFASSAVSAEDWTRFRGPNGTGVSPDSVPTTWSESKPAVEGQAAGIRVVQPDRRRFARLRHLLFRLRHGR